MSSQTHIVYTARQAGPYVATSLGVLPMLVIGLVLALGGMIVALALS